MAQTDKNRIDDNNPAGRGQAETMKTDTITHRYDFLLAFDVTDGNPNGDPDAGNLPRVDPQTGHGLVTDVCLKRKVRNYVLTKHHGQAPFDIFVKEKSVLNNVIRSKADDAKIELEKEKTRGEQTEQLRQKMCDDFYDVRTFGAVMSTGINAGQVRGPVQLTFARSVTPVVSLEYVITRMAVTSEEDSQKQNGENRTMGRKANVPYGLYVAHGFISVSSARRVPGQRVQGTGFGNKDLALFWEALEQMFEHDRSAARGLMATRKLVIFRHDDDGHGMGVAPAHQLFERVHFELPEGVVPRRFSDYDVRIDGNAQQRSVREEFAVTRKDKQVILTRID